MKVTQRFVFLVAVLLLVAGSAFGQGTTGSLNGTVTHEGAPLPGVTITISSPSLIGTRVGVSNVNGDYNFPALPPGDYTVKFEMEGMGTVTKTIKVGLAKTERVNALMQLSAVADVITVTAAAPAVLETTEVQSNYEAEMIEDLPIGRTVQNTVQLAPGVTGSATAIVVSGAYAYDTLYLVNGAVTNENVRGQTDNLYIEDAIQETSIITGSVSAEYGRFTGGVVSAITKSGGNEFSGSFRDSFTNPSWDKTTDFGEPQQDSVTDEVYEATLGGRIIRDRLWFFGAGRDAEQTFPGFFINGGANPLGAQPRPATIQTDERYEVKLTGQVTPKHSLVGSYLSYEVDQTPHCAFGCWDINTMDIDGRQLPREMITAQYNGILTSNFLIEAGYSTRDLVFENSGGNYRSTTDPFNVVPGSANFESQIRDLALGTWAYDYTVAGGAWGAPIFCGVCDPESRENEYYLLKGTYYLATAGAGTHNIVAGYENFAESRFANNYQSGSNFDIYVYSTPPEYEDDGTFRPILNYGDVLRYVPIGLLSKGSDFVTESFFINDKWDLGSKWSFNIGFRYDANDGQDSAGKPISDDSNTSPRLSVIYDINGDGRFRVNASYSRYVSRIQETIGGAAGGGNPSYFGYYYTGDQIGGRGTGMGSFDVITEMFRWFYENGGLSPDNPFLVFAVVPGANTRFDGSLKSPNVDEFTIGFGTQIGSKGFVRFDYIDKDWQDFYSVETSPNDQVVVAGSLLDVRTTTNNNDVEKTYQGLSVQANYRLTDRFNIGGNYTWSEQRGNEVGETTGGGPGSSAVNLYREYKAYARNNPVGFLPNDQEHKARIWVSYDQPLGMFGNLNFSLLERFDSGAPYSAAGNVNVSNYVTNPGYATPPTSAFYYFSDRGEFRFEDATATDLALNWELPIKKVNIFVQGELINAFNEQAQVGGSSSIAVISGVTFNPFTDTPQECPAGTATATCRANGQVWRKATNFGQATGAASYQLPLTYRFSAGIRF
ncbi:MAG: TonB-dependent receptor [Acidobacteria bacterium]|nr:TonB-dependent receptor [Acidobacteriota bacterium]